jgi:hypothetical protein
VPCGALVYAPTPPNHYNNSRVGLHPPTPHPP